MIDNKDKIETIPEKKSDGATPKALSESARKDVQKEYEASREYQKMDNRLEKWHDHKEYLNCRWNDPDSDDEDIVAINSIWSNAQTELPDLYFRQPKVTIEAESDTFPITIGGQEMHLDNFEACKLFQIRINNVVKNMRVEPIWERIIMDSISPYGYGCGKVGYALETESEWTNEYKRTSFWFRRLDPRNIFFDLFGDDFSQLQTTYEVIARQRSSLLSNPLYNKTAVREMRKASYSDANLPEALKRRLEQAGKTYDPDIVMFVEVHDMQKKTIRWLDLDGSPSEIRPPIRRKRWFEGSDYIFCSLNVQTDDNIYPLSDIDPIIDQAKSRSETRTSIEQHIRSWGTIIGYPEGMLDDDKLENIKRVHDRLFIPMSHELIAAGGFQVFDPPAISGDWYRLDDMDRRDNSETLGLPDYMQQGAKKTATHDALVDNKVNKRINRRRRKIQLAQLEMYRKIAGLIQEYDSGETRLNVGKHIEDKQLMEFLEKMSEKQKDQRKFNPERPFISVTREWWQGEYGFDYEVEEQLDRPKGVQVQQLNNTVNTITGNPFLSRAFYDDPATPKKVIDKLFSLQGWNIESLKSPPKADIAAGVENEMIEAGDPMLGPEMARDLQLPMPSELNNDAEHIITHYRLMQELQSKLKPLMSKEMKTPEDMQVGQFIQKSIQKLQKHLLMHDLQTRQKLEKDQMAFMSKMGGMGGQQPMNPQQPQSPNEAQPPRQIPGGKV